MTDNSAIFAAPHFFLCDSYHFSYNSLLCRSQVTIKSSFYEHSIVIYLSLIHIFSATMLFLHCSLTQRRDYHNPMYLQDRHKSCLLYTSCYSETLWYRKTDLCHLSKISTLSTEKVSHGHVTLFEGI